MAVLEVQAESVHAYLGQQLLDHRQDEAVGVGRDVAVVTYSQRFYGKYVHKIESVSSLPFEDLREYIWVENKREREQLTPIWGRFFTKKHS